MTKLCALAITVVLLGSSAVHGQTVTVTPKTNANPIIPPPVGQKAVYAEGQYTLMPNQAVNKVVAKWYQQVGQNLVFFGAVSDLNPANGKYTTTEFGVPTRDAQNNLIKYTVIVELYVVGNQNSVAGAVSQNYTP